MNKSALLALLSAIIVISGLGAFVLIDEYSKFNPRDTGTKNSEDPKKQILTQETKFSLLGVYKNEDGLNILALRNTGNRNLSVIENGSKTLEVLINDQNISWKLNPETRRNNVKIEPSERIEIVTSSNATDSTKYTIKGPHNSMDSKTMKPLD